MIDFNMGFEQPEVGAFSGCLLACWRFPSNQSIMGRSGDYGETSTVVTTNPGASAHQVELEVIDPLEKSISTMKDVDFVRVAHERPLNDYG